MRSKAEFLFTLALGFGTVFLMGWRGVHGPAADWVFGLLAVIWSLVMMLRIMNLTVPARGISGGRLLAQKIIDSMRQKQEERRRRQLETAFGGSYLLFLGGGIVFAVWQGFCAAWGKAYPSAIDGILIMAEDFLGGRGQDLPLLMLRGFDWGQGFMMLLALAMMGFVLRSYAQDRDMLRPALLVLCGYAVAGLILFAGLNGGLSASLVPAAGFAGQGAGAASYLRGMMPEGAAISLFDLLLIESGVAGLAILAFLLFIPLGSICLGVSAQGGDAMIAACGILTGIALILSCFLPFSALLGGFMILCWMALFLAWGHGDQVMAGNAALRQA
ncbi:MAG: hypothetical protein WC989_05900 [Micavibrio sp.]